ncbi:MAG: hypothetical protein QOK48_1294 [Blastocatellia bacterium]|nr:hypothetical protein [Blastocatellia bacterium]
MAWGGSGFAIPLLPRLLLEQAPHAWETKCVIIGLV